VSIQRGKPKNHPPKKCVIFINSPTNIADNTCKWCTAVHGLHFRIRIPFITHTSYILLCCLFNYSGIIAD